MIALRVRAKYFQRFALFVCDILRGDSLIIFISSTVKDSGILGDIYVCRMLLEDSNLHYSYEDNILIHCTCNCLLLFQLGNKDVMKQDSILIALITQ